VTTASSQNDRTLKEQQSHLPLNRGDRPADHRVLCAQLADSGNTIATYRQKLQTADDKIAQLLDTTKLDKALICRLQADLADAQTKNNALKTERQELKRDNT
jgi:hypothetical protein